MANLQIIKDVLKEKGLTVRYLAGELGMSEQGLQKLIRENSTKIETLESIANILKVSTSIFFNDNHLSPESIQKGKQIIAGSNIGHDNHMVNISMPESGTQKIIRASGEVEIQREAPEIKDDESRLVEARKEIEQLKLTIDLLKDNIRDKNDLIASLKDTIELLRHKQ